MLSSWPQTKADYNPLRRPKGTINSYASVVNTANDHKLLRHRIREIVLAVALSIGFYQNEIRAQWLYRTNKKRIEQCTFLYAKSIVSPQRKREFSDTLYQLPAAIYKTLLCFFKSNETELYDTKKFRIYRQRLEYGPKNRHGYRKITLHHIIQYMSTPLFACMLGLYSGNILEPGKDQLDISAFDFFKRAYDKSDTARELQKYLDVVLKIPGLQVTKNGKLVFLTPESKEAFWQAVNNEAEILYKELEGGGYLGNKK